MILFFFLYHGDTMTDSNYVGNISTIIKVFAMTFAGWIIALFASQGLDLGVDATTLGEIIGIIIGFNFAYIDAKYPNTFSWLRNVSIETEETIEDDNNADEYA